MNRIAIFGHRGWAASHIVSALYAAGAPLKVIHRPGSDTKGLPSNIVTAEAAFDDEDSLVAALKDIDIAISLVGFTGFADQLKLVPALKRAGVSLFVPSDLSLPIAQKDLEQFPILKIKTAVQDACTKANLPFTLVYVGAFAEYSLAASNVGIDIVGNRFIMPEGAEDKLFNLCSAPYAAAAYASLFAQTPPVELAGRKIWLTELLPSGTDIANALASHHGSPPHIVKTTNDKLENAISGSPPRLNALWMRMRADGTLHPPAGADIFEVPGYKKETLESWLSGRLSPGRVPGLKWEDVAATVQAE